MTIYASFFFFFRASAHFSALGKIVFTENVLQHCFWNAILFSNVIGFMVGLGDIKV